MLDSAQHQELGQQKALSHSRRERRYLLSAVALHYRCRALYKVAVKAPVRSPGPYEPSGDHTARHSRPERQSGEAGTGLRCCMDFTASTHRSRWLFDRETLVSKAPTDYYLSTFW